MLDIQNVIFERMEKNFAILAQQPKRPMKSRKGSSSSSSEKDSSLSLGHNKREHEEKMKRKDAEAINK